MQITGANINRPNIQGRKKAKMQKKNDKDTNAASSVKAYLAANLAKSAFLLPLNILTTKAYSNVRASLTAEEKTALNSAADNILKNSGLAEKGVKILNITEKKPLAKDIKGSFYNSAIKNYNQTADGLNAGFEPGRKILKEINNIFPANSIYCNREKSPEFLFHEMGHAFNKNCSKFWNAVQKMRTPASWISLGIFLFAANTKKETAQEGEELTKGQKAKNFVRNHSGILAAGAYLPVAAEEIAATVRGNAWANKNLSAELAKKVKRGNMLGILTYIELAAASGLAAFAAAKIKDRAVEKAQNNNQQKVQDNLKVQQQLLDI